MYVFKNRADIELKCVLYRSGVTKSHTKKCRRYDSFVYYLSGGHQFDFSNQSIKASAGEIIYLPLGSSYTNRVLSSDTEYYQIEFKIFDNGKPVPLFDEPKVIQKGKSAEYARLFAEAHNYYTKRAPAYVNFCIADILTVIGMLESEKSNNNLYEANRIAPSLTYINEHYDLDTSVEELAKISATSVSNFEKIFKQHFGMTPSAYRNSIRIERAKQLLAGAYSIEETAKLTGFSDRYYFSRIFKKITGYSPRAYIRSLEI